MLSLLDAHLTQSSRAGSLVFVPLFSQTATSTSDEGPWLLIWSSFNTQMQHFQELGYPQFFDQVHFSQCFEISQLTLSDWNFHHPRFGCELRRFLAFRSKHFPHRVRSEMNMHKQQFFKASSTRLTPLMSLPSPTFLAQSSLLLSHAFPWPQTHFPTSRSYFISFTVYPTCHTRWMEQAQCESFAWLRSEY